MNKMVFLVITFFSMAIASAVISVYLMSGYTDCRLGEPFFNHTIPAAPSPDNCASNMRMLIQTLFSYLSFTFIVLSVGIPFFVSRSDGKCDGSMSIK